MHVAALSGAGSEGTALDGLTCRLPAKGSSRRRLAAAALLLLAGCSQQQPSTDLVFVSDEGSNVVHIVDGATGRVEGALAAGRRPRGMQLSPDGRILYVAASDSNRIEAWDVRARRLMRVLNS